MAADRRSPAETPASEPPLRLEEIRRRELERALARLDGPVSDRKREVVDDLARAIASAVGPAAVATVRAGRTSASGSGRSPGTAGEHPESGDP